MDCTPSLARDEPSRLFGAPTARTSATRSMPTIRVLPCHAALGTRWLAFTPHRRPDGGGHRAAESADRGVNGRVLPRFTALYGSGRHLLYSSPSGQATLPETRRETVPQGD